ncbi:hypothetical protein I551_7364 [Mycobacterium ulcerans str. Harvey]|uniref:Uncharacterized protein n=1 Tax=Mycobacterium ulcerans str. Harvey TaxID=1299332 RepID=A0ABN0QNM7_MYCUL|nr:hypothetical protein I551_7364 [Mycobacterium ulcerans str. Harvey]
MHRAVGATSTLLTIPSSVMGRRSSGSTTLASAARMAWVVED